MSKTTFRKEMDYIRKEYERTRTMPGSWYLNSYKYKYNVTHLKPFLDKLGEEMPNNHFIECFLLELSSGSLVVVVVRGLRCSFSGSQLD